MRFLHLADVHLDTPFASRSEAVRQRLRDASRDAFRHAIDVAIREDVDAVLVAGDLFDGERLSFQTERFLLEQAARLEAHGITLVYATGNHDPGSGRAPAREAGGSGPGRLRWPANTHVAADATPQRIRIHDASGSAVGFVTAIGHATDRETSDLSRLLPRPDGEMPEVALLHTQVHASPGGESHHAYAPSDLGYLRRSGYDYWALGHVHVRQMLSHDPPVAYAGSLQGRTHADTGPRGALLVDLSDRGAPQVSFSEVALVRWETLRVGGLTEADSLDGLERRVQAAWRAARTAEPGRSGSEWMVRVILEGTCPLWAELRREENVELLAGELRELLGALDVVVDAGGVSAVVAVEEHRARADVLGAVLQLTQRVREGETAVPGIEAGDLAGVGSDEAGAVAAYVRGLLGGADEELAARLLGISGRR
jgi:DNA repair exonuclease SbcCD nuclease subunit